MDRRHGAAQPEPPATVFLAATAPNLRHLGVSDAMSGARGAVSGSPAHRDQGDQRKEAALTEHRG
jgi:hypothetical protein